MGPIRAIIGTLVMVLLLSHSPVHSFAAVSQAGQVIKRSTQTMPFPDKANDIVAPRINRPFFDPSGELRWADDLVHIEATGLCDTQPPQKNTNGYPIFPRQTKLLAPRVDERLCSRPGTPSEITIVGVDRSGKKTWERDAKFPSGTHRLDQRLIGASADGLVMSSLEVWSAQTGETLIPAVTRTIPSEVRAVPVHAYTGGAVFHAGRRVVYVFDADVTLTKRQGGLYEINPASNGKKLVHPVVTTKLSGFDRIEALAVTPDGRYLALAQRLSRRGPSDVSFAVLDLTTERLAFHERHCQSSQEVCAEPLVVIGPQGAVGFSYANLNRREHYLIFYQLSR
jgi:hypothetical protein